MSTVGSPTMTASHWKSLTSDERAQIRQFHLRQIEREQFLEEREALKMTEVRRLLLFDLRSHDDDPSH
jgi:hypothetical protein